MPYERHTYQLNRVTIIAPLVDNDGCPSAYVHDLRQRLAVHGFSWTEHRTRGVWQSPGRGLQREDGTLFELYLALEPAHATAQPQDHATIGLLVSIARSVMPDQDAIQITVDPNPTTLIEA